MATRKTIAARSKPPSPNGARRNRSRANALTRGADEDSIGASTEDDFRARRADARCAGIAHRQCGLHVPYAARCFDFDFGRAVGAHESDVFDGRATGTETRRSLGPVGA